MRAAVFIGIGIGFIVLGIIFRTASEPVNNKDGRKRLSEAVSLLAFFFGTFSLIAGVIFLILTLTQNSSAEAKFNLFFNDSHVSQQIKPEKTSDSAIESDTAVQANVTLEPPNGTQIEIAGAMASSELKSMDGQILYYANNSIDGDSASCWQVSGDEENAAITLFVKGKNKISSVSFSIGNQTDGCYSEYNRPRIIRIDFPNGRYSFAAFEDTAAVQTVYLPEPVRADSFTVTIADVYPGVINSTCISEISVYS